MTTAQIGALQIESLEWDELDIRRSSAPLDDVAQRIAGLLVGELVRRRRTDAA
jgi:hypothetical protein